MGPDGPFRLHDGRPSRVRHSGERDLPGQRGHGVFRQQTQGSFQSLDPRGCGPRLGSHPDTKAGKLCERISPAALAQVEGKAAISLEPFLLTIVVYTTIIPPCLPKTNRTARRPPSKSASSSLC